MVRPGSLPATATVVLVVLLAPFTVPRAAAADFIDDCIGDPNPQFNIGNPQGLDYYEAWEKPILGGLPPLGQEAPRSGVGATIITSCKINGHSIVGSPGFLCPDGVRCIKFWAWQRVHDVRGVQELASCGTAFVDGATLDPRLTHAEGDFLFCEWYCPTFIFQCRLGNTVEVRVSLSLSYLWEADDLPALPGDADALSHFEFESRPSRDVGSTVRQVEHVTCQAGLPVFHDFGLAC